MDDSIILVGRLSKSALRTLRILLELLRFGGNRNAVNFRIDDVFILRSVSKVRPLPDGPPTRWEMKSRLQNGHWLRTVIIASYCKVWAAQ
jgi:hypothetical protein